MTRKRRKKLKEYHKKKQMGIMMTDYEYDEYREVMKQALLTMNELLDSFEDKEKERK